MLPWKQLIGHLPTKYRRVHCFENIFAILSEKVIRVLNKRECHVPVCFRNKIRSTHFAIWSPERVGGAGTGKGSGGGRHRERVGGAGTGKGSGGGQAQGLTSATSWKLSFVCSFSSIPVVSTIFYIKERLVGEEREREREGREREEREEREREREREERERREREERERESRNTRVRRAPIRATAVMVPSTR